MTNEPAERLRVAVQRGAEYPARRGLLLKLIDETLAAERRATVERIRAALQPTKQRTNPVYPLREVEAILDAEAQR
jgi:hypothetical protein